MSLRTQPIKADSYTLDISEANGLIRVRLTGTFDMMANPDLALFLVSLEGDIKRQQLREIVVDVTEVYYIGSSSIKSFVALIEATKKLDFHPQTRLVTNPRLDWQERTFSILQRLAPALVTIEKAK